MAKDNDIFNELATMNEADEKILVGAYIGCELRVSQKETRLD